MLSRVADSLYWMARYSERAENQAHILGVQLVRMLEHSSEDGYSNKEWHNILDICGSNEEYNRYYQTTSTRDVVQYLAFSTRNTNSLVNLVHYIRENARVTRDNIPNDLWQVWNELYLEMQQQERKLTYSLLDMRNFLHRINTVSMVATGIVESSMSRDIPYRFIKIGKLLERAEKTIRILQTLHSATNEGDGKLLSGDVTLQLINGCEDFSNKYRFNDEGDILQYVISDRTFPRSIGYCMESVKKELMEIENERVAHYSFEMFSSIEDFITALQETNVSELTFREREEFLSEILKKCMMFSKIFATTYYLIEADITK